MIFPFSTSPDIQHRPFLSSRGIARDFFFQQGSSSQDPKTTAYSRLVTAWCKKSCTSSCLQKAAPIRHCRQLGANALEQHRTKQHTKAEPLASDFALSGSFCPYTIRNRAACPSYGTSGDTLRQKVPKNCNIHPKSAGSQRRPRTCNNCSTSSYRTPGQGAEFWFR